MERIIEDLRQSDRFACYMERQGWKIENLKIDNGQLKIFIKKFGLFTEARILRNSTSLNWVKLKAVLKKNRVYKCTLEPREENGDIKVLAQHGFEIDKSPFRATKTILVNLAESEPELMASFKRARSSIKKLAEDNHKVIMDDFESFFEMWSTAARKQKIWSSSKPDYVNLVKCFKNSCFCITVEDVCGCLILVHKGTAYYYYGATLPQARENRFGYLAVWEAMQEAKRRGCNVWDWEGIYDTRWPNKAWAGFSQFKREFGGVEVEMPGSFVRTSLMDAICG